MPSQKIESSRAAISDNLVGLKHYNDKKRLDAINWLLRTGQDSIGESMLSEVFTSLGTCISDEDALVRSKASSFLFSLLSNRERNVVCPFVSRLSLQIIAALANVKQPIRHDAVVLLRRFVPFGLLSASEIRSTLRSLFEVSGSLQSVNTSRTVKNVDEQRQSVYAAVEELLESLCKQRESIEAGSIESNEWNITSIISKVLWPVRDIDLELRRFLNLLSRQGENILREKIEALAFEAGLLTREPAANAKPQNESDRKSRAHSKSSGTVFSKLSLLMRDEDSD
jgi:hypothetical protein